MSKTRKVPFNPSQYSSVDSLPTLVTEGDLSVAIYTLSGNNPHMPIVGSVNRGEDSGGWEYRNWGPSGKEDDRWDSPDDLYVLEKIPEPVSLGWINVYKTNSVYPRTGFFYFTKENALANVGISDVHVACVEVFQGQGL